MKIINALLLISIFTFTTVPCVHANQEDKITASEFMKNENTQSDVACNALDPRGCGN